MLDGHRDRINALAVTHRGKLVSAGCDDHLRVWDPISGRCCGMLLGHRDSVNDVLVVGESYALSVSGSEGLSREASLRLWNLETLACDSLLPLPAGGRCLLGTFEEHRVAVLLGNGNLAIVQLEGLGG